VLETVPVLYVLTACWELLRQVRRLVSQDKSESHRPHPREWRRLQRRLRICCGTCCCAGGPARMECQATTVSVEEELGLGWPLVYVPLDRDNWPTRVTRPCPRGPEAIGLGPDWSGVRYGRRAGLDQAEGEDIRRTGPTRATGQ
jgi:hypothetical protein